MVQLQPKDLFVLLLGITDITGGPQFNRIHNGNFELSEGHMQPISLWLIAAVMIFGAIHMSAWNFRFTTKVERILWRIGGIATTILPLFFLLSSSISSAEHTMEEELHRFETASFHFGKTMSRRLQTLLGQSNPLICFWEPWFPKCLGG
jgi:hypothetical protein